MLVGRTGCGQTSSGCLQISVFFCEVRYFVCILSFNGVFAVLTVVRIYMLAMFGDLS